MAYQMTAFEKEMEAMLSEQRNVLIDKIAKSNDDFQALVGTMGIRDSIDLASEDMAISKMEAVNKLDASSLKAIDQALIRLKAGNFGVCKKCGKKIPEGRLRALPFAVLCVECKNKDESPNRF
ncbi:MAG: TraR/DksA C4-type zinc finger protein [Sphaerochaetaceae bacterium]|nr:TraR/DksA C4-type zinc finger protein [Sphaerochaetaceae bacterium]